MKKIISLIVLSVFILSSFSSIAEGTKDLRPTSADFGYLNPYDWGGEFATYNSPVDNRLNVSIADHTREKIYIGFKAKNNPAYFRVKRPDGTIISGPHLIPSFVNATGYIDDYAQAAAGPSKFNANGYVAIVVDPDVNGDYYIEINQGDPVIKAPLPATNGGYTYNLFDVTVVDTVTSSIKSGRLWAKQWALSTGNQSQFFRAQFTVLRDDSIRFEVDYNGIDPFGFGIISNSWGIKNTGDFKEDRKSTSTPKYTQGNVPYLPEHKIFLNSPDSLLYPYPKTSPSISVSNTPEDLITGCITTGYCINVQTSKPGQAEVKLDLDAVPGYQSGGRDVLVYGQVGSGNGCIPWDGFDGLGDTAFSANIEINYKYESGFIHIPIYDAENHAGGYKFTLMPSSNPATWDTLKLYWDDTNFNSVASGINLTGCTVPCRNWINNYGNERFLNTWSFAFDQTIVLSNTQFDFCPPEVFNDTVALNENSNVIIIPLSNDIAPLNQFDKPTFQITCNPSNGTFVILPNQRVQYTPNIGFIGFDTICYNICDTNTPAACRDGLMLIEVIDINVPPAATTVNGKPVANKTSDSLTTPEDVPLQICIQWIEYEGQGITATSSLGTPSHGTLQNFADGDSCFTYVPNPDYNGLDTLWIELCDDQMPQACDTVIIPIVVTPVNDPPVLTPGPSLPPLINDSIIGIVITEDISRPICFLGVDSDGDSIYVSSVVVQPANGTLTGVGQDSCFTYTPDPNYNGADTATVIICDNGIPPFCDTITLTFNNIAVNDPPVAPNDTLFVDPGDTESSYVLANDFDIETSHPNLTFTIIGGPFLPGAIATIVNDSIQYVAPAGVFIAIDTVFYSVCDTGNPVLCTTGTLLVAIPKSDSPPIASDDIAVVPEDSATFIDILINDIDPNLDPLTFTILTLPQHGTAIDSNNMVYYVPAPNYNGPDSLQYVICDNTIPTPFCDTAWVHINVTPVNDNPQILDQFGNPLVRLVENINEDTPITICFNATEVDPSQSMDVTAATSFLNNGMITGLNNGDTCFTYTPNPNFYGIDSLTVYVCDNGTPAACDSVIVVINIAPINDKPVALNDTVSTGENTPVLISPLNNDGDLVELTALDTAGLAIITNPLNGTFVINNDGTINYTPNLGFAGLDSMEYRICDTGIPLPAVCATAWIFINVDPINDPPVAVDDILSTPQNTAVSINVILNDSDPENDPLTVSIISGPSNGSIVLTGSSIAYTPANGFCGIDTIFYRVCDNGTPALCDSAMVIVSVIPEDFDNDLLSNAYETLTLNSDNDAVNDYLDIDSDNDGIHDSTEAKIIGGDLCNPLAFDFDGDKTPDYRDLDSDNDCIPDYVERSLVLVAPTGLDSDNDGIDDAYDPDNGGSLERSLVDSDGDGFPDVRDTDSDGDGIPDWIEATIGGVIASGFDSDDDGIDDIWDVDNNGNGLCDKPVDTDGDGIPDFRDLDTDGDGVVDADERGPNGNNPRDTDGDGIPDFRETDSDGDGIDDGSEGRDSDCDNDGIPDYLDPDSCIPAPPNGFSPNGDGTNDTYIIDPILTTDPGLYPNNTFIIFNRWGNRVYEKGPYDNSWGGESNVDNTVGESNKLPIGTYYYIFDYGVAGIPQITGFIYLKQ